MLISLRCLDIFGGGVVGVSWIFVLLRFVFKGIKGLGCVFFLSASSYGLGMRLYQNCS